MIKLGPEELLFKEQDTSLSFYLVILGKIILHSKSLGAIGIAKMGDFVGEDIIYEKLSIQNLRTESAYSEGDTFLLEFQLDDWRKLKDIFMLMGLKKDYLNIENSLKKAYQ